MRRLLAVLGAAGLLLLGSLGVAGGAVAATAASTTTCSNGVDNTPGLGLICQVTIVNTDHRQRRYVEGHGPRVPRRSRRPDGRVHARRPT